MSDSPVKDLMKIAEAIYLREYEGVRKILEQESRILTRIQELEQQSRSVLEQDPGQSRYKNIGAEVQWKAWENRERRNLSIQLAQIRVRKEQQLAGYRIATARKSALEEAQARALARNMRIQSRQAQTRLIQLAILSAPRNRTFEQ